MLEASFSEPRHTCMRVGGQSFSSQSHLPAVPGDGARSVCSTAHLAELGRGLEGACGAESSDKLFLWGDLDT